MRILTSGCDDTVLLVSINICGMNKCMSGEVNGKEAQGSGSEDREQRAREREEWKRVCKAAIHCHFTKCLESGWRCLSMLGK